MQVHAYVNVRVSLKGAQGVENLSTDSRIHLPFFATLKKWRARVLARWSGDLQVGEKNIVACGVSVKDPPVLLLLFFQDFTMLRTRTHLYLEYLSRMRRVLDI